MSEAYLDQDMQIDVGFLSLGAVSCADRLYGSARMQIPLAPLG